MGHGQLAAHATHFSSSCCCGSARLLVEVEVLLQLCPGRLGVELIQSLGLSKSRCHRFIDGNINAVQAYDHALHNSLLVVNMPIGMSIGWGIAHRYLLTPSIGMRICRSIRTYCLDQQVQKNWHNRLLFL